MSKPGPKKGSTKSAAHKKKLASAVMGSKNGRFKDGRRSYRRRAGAKPNDGTVVHHNDGNRNNNSKSNLTRLKGKKAGTNTTSKHEKMTKRGQGRPKGRKNRTRKLSGGVTVKTFKLYGTRHY